jgi:hypothetical protein
MYTAGYLFDLGAFVKRQAARLLTGFCLSSEQDTSAAVRRELDEYLNMGYETWLQHMVEVHVSQQRKDKYGQKDIEDQLMIEMRPQLSVVEMVTKHANLQQVAGEEAVEDDARVKLQQLDLYAAPLATRPIWLVHLT